MAQLLIRWGIDSYSVCLQNKTAFEHFRSPAIKQSKYHPSPVLPSVQVLIQDVQYCPRFCFSHQLWATLMLLVHGPHAEQLASRASLPELQSLCCFSWRTQLQGKGQAGLF